jgi:CheY-like chemotaxis protein
MRAPAQGAATRRYWRALTQRRDRFGVDPHGTSRVILVVEDEWVVRAAIAEELRGAGWQVLEASSAEDAIALDEAGQRIDILFTDIQLAGGLSGWDLAEHFRALEATLPIIYTSGNLLIALAGSLAVCFSISLTNLQSCSRSSTACSRVRRTDFLTPWGHVSRCRLVACHFDSQAQGRPTLDR